MPQSAGLLLYRRTDAGIEVLLAHPGGPFWAARDEGAWSLPKGETDPGEDPLDAARREFEEEVGVTPPDGPFIDLGTARLRSGKRVLAWAAEGELEPATQRSTEVPVEWPPHSGRRIMVPEVDRVAWFGPAEARRRLNPAQAVFVDRLVDELELDPGSEERAG
jgi:predicted NUDIX family NTP pyrophosphohydrolase